MPEQRHARIAAEAKGMNARLKPGAEICGLAGSEALARIDESERRPAPGFSRQSQLMATNAGKTVLPKKSGIELNFPDLSGVVSLNKSGASRQLVARFKRIAIPDLEQNEPLRPTPTPSNVPKSETQNFVESSIDPRTMPVFDIEITDLRYADLDFGTIRLGAKRDKTGLHEITGTIEAPSVTGEIDDGEWTKTAAGNSQSFFRGRMIFSDTGAVFKKLKVFEGLRGGRSTYDFDARWKGAPWQMALSRANGFMLFKLAGGELLSVDSVFIKLIDILTLKSLKFYEKGSKIEQADGKLRFQDGKLTMDLVNLDLSSSNVKFKGDVDLVQETIATDVGLEIKIGSAVAVGTVGVVAGPAVALLGYLAKDNIKLPQLEFLNKLTAFSYRLEGPWAEPKVSAFRPKPFGF